MAWVLSAAVLSCGALEGWAAEPAADSGKESVAAERAQLFIGLLKRRAQRILEAHRVPPPPLFAFSSGVVQGYESNVDLDGERRGDTFIEENASLTFRPVFRPWAQGEFSWDLLKSNFLELTDSDLWSNTFSALLKVQPHRILRLDLGGEYGILNFPRDSDSSFDDRRVKAHLSAAQTGWLTHKAGWVYQLRVYDTRNALDADSRQVAGLSREDQRHTAQYELQFRFPRTFVKIGGDFYRNLSNDQSQEYYDWQGVRLKGVLTQVLKAGRILIFSASHERKNYEVRSVPAINVAERDNLLTLAGSFLYPLNSRILLTPSVTYRHQDSNDPRLDFTDWIFQVGVSVSF